MASESWITVVTYVRGRRTAQRHGLTVPLHLATGRLEKLSDLQITEALRDLRAEQARRAAPQAAGWNPYTALRKDSA